MIYIAAPAGRLHGQRKERTAEAAAYAGGSGAG